MYVRNYEFDNIGKLNGFKKLLFNEKYLTPSKVERFFMNPLQNPPERKKYLFHFLGFDFDLTRLSLKDLFWWMVGEKEKLKK